MPRVEDFRANDVDLVAQSEKSTDFADLNRGEVTAIRNFFRRTKSRLYPDGDRTPFDEEYARALGRYTRDLGPGRYEALYWRQMFSQERGPIGLTVFRRED